MKKSRTVKHLLVILVFIFIPFFIFADDLGIEELLAQEINVASQCSVAKVS
jgi:hypothetical protein